MPLNWNEIKSRAIAFSKEWEHTEREEAEAKPFLIEFLNVFGISRKKVATFKQRVKKLDQAPDAFPYINSKYLKRIADGEFLSSEGIWISR